MPEPPPPAGKPANVPPANAPLSPASADAVARAFRYEANLRLIRCRLADGDRTARLKWWWKLR